MSLLDEPVADAPAPVAAADPGAETSSGWDTWRQREFLYANRDWQAVTDFYRAVVRGDASLADIGLEDPLQFSLHARRIPADAQTLEPGGGIASAAAQEGAPAESAAGVPDRPMADSRGGDDTLVRACQPMAQCGGEAGGEDADERSSNRRQHDRGGGHKRAGHRRLTYKVTINYFGDAFSGWQSQPGRVTVQGTLQAALQELAGLEGPKVLVASAGRTDAGVHANGMPISFYSWERLQPERVLSAINAAAPGQLTALGLEERPRQFHATFSAQWRRYVYLFPLRTNQAGDGSSSLSGTADGGPRPLAAGSTATVPATAGTGAGSRPYIPPEVYARDPDPALLAQMLSALQGSTLDFSACARDTPAGKDGICTLHVCRCEVLELPARPGTPSSCQAPLTAKAHVSSAAPGETPFASTQHHNHPNGQHQAGLAVPPRRSSELPCDVSVQCMQGPSRGSAGVSCDASRGEGSTEGVALQSGPLQRVRVLCVELVGNRFLRKMVRVLVSTALLEATCGAGRYDGRPSALLECLAAGRDATGMPAPATGLCFAGAGYD